MTRAEKWMVGFLCLIVAAFVAEHIVIFYLNMTDPMVLEACPQPNSNQTKR